MIVVVHVDALAYLFSLLEYLLIRVLYFLMRIVFCFINLVFYDVQVDIIYMEYGGCRSSCVMRLRRWLSWPILKLIEELRHRYFIP